MLDKEKETRLAMLDKETGESKRSNEFSFTLLKLDLDCTAGEYQLGPSTSNNPPGLLARTVVARQEENQIFTYIITVTPPHFNNHKTSLRSSS
jgi:hypothetical protein